MSDAELENILNSRGHIIVFFCSHLGELISVRILQLRQRKSSSAIIRMMLVVSEMLLHVYCCADECEVPIAASLRESRAWSAKFDIFPSSF